MPGTLFKILIVLAIVVLISLCCLPVPGTAIFVAPAAKLIKYLRGLRGKKLKLEILRVMVKCSYQMTVQEIEKYGMFRTHSIFPELNALRRLGYVKAEIVTDVPKNKKERCKMRHVYSITNAGLEFYNKGKLIS